MQNKQWRLDNAKLAKAYMAGGMPPFQAAQKCGFMRVSYMEDALRELEASEQANSDMVKAGPVQNAPTARPEQTHEYRNSKFLIKRFAERDGYPEMIRVFAGGRISYIYFTPDDIPLLQALLREVTGEKDQLLASFAELTDERNHEGEQALKEMQRADELQQRLAERDERIIQLESELAEKNQHIEELSMRPDAQDTENGNALLEKLKAVELLNQRLKDKLVELILGV